MYAQLGGMSTYSYLNLPVSPKATALGGSTGVIFGKDLNATYENPSMADTLLHKNISFNNGFYYKGSNFGKLAYGHYCKPIKAIITTGIIYNSYGKFDGRDPSGNPTGNFRAGEYAVYGSISQQWKNFYYGLTTSLLFSNLADYSSIGLSFNAGVAYHHPKKKLTFTAYIKNGGIQLKPYIAGQKEKLPLQLNIGLSKRFEKLPITMQVVLHDLQQYDLSFPELEQNNLFTGQSSIKKTPFIDNLFRHFIFGADIEIAKPISLRLAYNHFDRKTLSFQNKEGLTGLSAGFGIHIQAFDFDYGIAPSAGGNTLHHLGLNFRLNDLGSKAD